MAKKAPSGRKAKKPKRARATSKRPKPKRPRLRSPAATVALVNAGVHDFTNLATAVRAYLELMDSQGRLEEKQKYYLERAREQVEMMVDLVREIKEKIN